MSESSRPPAPPPPPPPAPPPAPAAAASTPPRLRRTLELVYAVEGVSAARVWQWDGAVAIGIRPAPACAPDDVLRRVESAVAGLREPGETWEFGLLEDP